MSALSIDTNRYTVSVQRIVHETPTVATVHFQYPSGFKYTAGQYITVFFDDTNVVEGKAYSLSSHPDDIDLSITVKNVGLFSGKLHDLKPGDNLTISPAYGMFNAFGKAPLVALAAGVGIAPIYSIIRHEVFCGSQRPVKLLYTNTVDEEIAFYDELNRMTGYAPNIEVDFVVTRQKDSVHYGPRLDGGEIAKAYKGRMVCICGTVEFVRDLRRQLVSAGVDEADIMTEVFFETVGAGP